MSPILVSGIALLAVAAHANPLPKAPTKVIRRDPPAPSAYPLDTPCDHEWQYLNFDPSNANDMAHLTTLHNVICSGEMRAISSYGQISAQDALAPYLRFFPTSDDEDDYQGHVAGALGLIAGESSTDGAIGSIVGSFVIDNLDFAAGDPNENDCTDEGTLAYTLTDSLDNREKIHFCDIAWNRPSAGDIDCGSLDPYPSDKIDSFSRIALHEMLHYNSVGNQIMGQRIIDTTNNDGYPAYGTERTHGLVDENQDDNPAVAEINADSYAWMSVDAWQSRHCSPNAENNDWAAFFTQNPPAYTPEDDDSD